MTTRENILSKVTTVYLVLLLSGTLLFIPDIFVSRYVTPPRLWLQAWSGIGLLLPVFSGKGDVKWPPRGYIIVIVIWFFYHAARGNWNFESLVNYLTVIAAFLVFYRCRQVYPRERVVFALLACLGVVLSAWGLGQYAGWLPKQYSVFTMTGPFNNPAGLSASLAVLYPFALYSCRVSKGLPRGVSIAASLLMVVAVVSCGARAAILAVAVSTAVFAVHFVKERHGIRLTFFHHAGMGVACIALLAGLYFLKKDSADGRLLIWHCSGQLVKQAPLLGQGDNGFTARYMKEQARYFSGNPGSRYAMLADNVRHPFNEYIKEVVEYGVTGLLISITLVALPLYYSRNKRSLEISIVRLSLLSIGICAFFSYPLHYPFIRAIVVFLLSGLLPVKREPITCGFNNYRSKLTAGILSISILAVTIYQTRVEREWRTIAKNSLSGFTEEMLPGYRKLYSSTYLSENALFLYNYAAELNYTGEYSKSNIILLECRGYMDDMEVQMLLANNFEKKEDYLLAEQSLLLASRMIPARFFPLYRLAILYEKTEKHDKAREMAEIIIQKEIKVPSMKITVMKN